MFGGQGGGGWPLPGSNPPSSNHINGVFPNLATHSGGFVHSTNPYSNSTLQHRVQTSATSSSAMFATPSVSSGSSGMMMPPPASGRSSSSSSSSSRHAGTMPAPQNKNRTTLLQEEKRRAAMQRAQEQHEREQRAKAAQDLFSTPGLFSAPERVSDEDAGQVAQVLGMFSDAHSVINSKGSCIGIEYQPPTPAPSMQHHIIGDDDDDRPSMGHPLGHRSMSGIRMSEVGQASSMGRLSHHQSNSHHLHQQQQQQLLQLNHLQAQRRGPPSMPRPPSSQRLPENINQTHRPTDKNSVRQPATVNPRHLPPPSGLPPSSAHHRPYHVSPQGSNVGQRSAGSPNLLYVQQQQQQQTQQMSNSFGVPDVALPSSASSRLKQASKNLPKLSSVDCQADDVQFQAMLSEMKSICPPLTAIVTPRVEPGSHMGNMSRLGMPKYFSATNLPPIMTPLSDSPLRMSDDLPSLSRPHESSKGLAASGSGFIPYLSEDSDSDNPKSSEKSSSKSLLAAAAVVPPPKPTPKPESPKPKFSSNNSSSADSSSDESSDSSEDSSDDDHAKAKKTSKVEKDIDVVNDLSDDEDDEDTNCIDNVFSLSSLITRVRSTHSPGGPSSNLSQHQPSPRNAENVASTLNSLGLPPNSPSDSLDKDDDDPILGFLSHTPQPLPDLIDDIAIPISPIPQSPIAQTPPRKSSSNVSSFASLSSAMKQRRDDTSDEDDGNVKRRKKRPTKSPSKRQQRKSIRISAASDDDDVEQPVVGQQQQEQQRAQAKMTPNGGRPLPRACATPVAKSSIRSDAEDEIASDNDVPEKKSARKRRSKKEMNESGEKRGKKKSSATPPTPPPSRVPVPALNAFISSSSSDEDEPDFGGAKSRRKMGPKKEAKFESPARSRPVSSSVKIEAKTEEDEEDEGKGSEKERSNKKTAISMIFASAKAGKNTGKSGIKVEMHHQPSPPIVPPPMMSPPTVAIKSQGLHQQASLISHPSPAPLAETQVRRTGLEPLRRRPDGRPSIMCRIPLTSIGQSLRDLFRPQKENKPYEQMMTSSDIGGRERRQSGCSTVSSASSRHSYKRHRRTRDESIGSESSFQVQQPPSKRSKTHESQAITGDSTSLMPPPNRVFYSYLEHRRPEEEEFDEDDINKFMGTAKRLKHDADAEQACARKANKYLQAVLYFSLCGNYYEVRGDKHTAFNMYKDTLELIRQVMKNPSNGASSSGNTVDNKLAVLSHRCQSLLYLRMYKLCKKELTECHKILENHLMKANTTGSQHNSPNGQPTISPTPSPAGSEGSVCSKSSGYTSANELMGAGGLQPPLSLTVPQSVMQKHHQYVNYLSQCHDLWETADLWAQRGHCEDFIIRLDRMYGPLTLHSSVKDMVKYTQNGLDILAKESDR